MRLFASAFQTEMVKEKTISNVHDFDHHRFTAQMRYQLRDADIPVPLMDFSSRNKREPGTMCSLAFGNKILHRINGVGASIDFKHLQSKWEFVHGGIFQSEDMFAPSGFTKVFSQAKPIDRLYGNLHEVSHYICDRCFDLSHVERQFILSSGLVSLTSYFVDRCHEEVADVSASLYMLSNLADKSAATRHISDLQQHRSLAFDVIHHTCEALSFAQKAFDETPRKGLSIVETTEWAVRLLLKKPQIINDFIDVVEACHIVLDVQGKRHDLENRYPLIKRAYEVRDDLWLKAELIAQQQPHKPNIKSRMYQFCLKIV